jgi:hypothetical protein
MASSRRSSPQDDSRYATKAGVPNIPSWRASSVADRFPGSPRQHPSRINPISRRLSRGWSRRLVQVHPETSADRLRVHSLPPSLRRLPAQRNSPKWRRVRRRNADRKAVQRGAALAIAPHVSTGFVRNGKLSISVMICLTEKGRQRNAKPLALRTARTTPICTEAGQRPIYHSSRDSSAWPSTWPQ